MSADRVSAAAGTVTGTVFQDFNMNGTMNTTAAVGVAADLGVAGIEVRAFDSVGTQVGSTTTGSGGTYSLSIVNAATTSVRIEFTIPTSNPSLSGLQPSYASTTTASGSSTGGSVQFATIGNTGVNFAVARPGEYCQNNPTLVTCAFDTGTGSTTNVGAFTFSSAMSGFTDVNANNTRIGSSRALGTIFGIGTDRQKNTFYGTFVRRHAEYGQAGAVNAIYRINVNNPGTVTTFVTLPGTLPAHDPTTVLTVPYGGDTGVFDDVGRIGLGDVDVTDDGKTLLAVDIDETAPKLYFVPINGSGNSVTAGAPVSLAVPKPSTFNSVSCPGTWHPMGIGTRGSRILVGGVCGAENTVSPSKPRGDNPTASTAFILEYSGARDASGSFQTVWAMNLSYARGCVYREGTRIPCNPLTSTVGSVGSADWAAWNEYPNLFALDGPTGGLFSVNPMAMLSNIEITDSGDLVVSFRDRHQDQIKTGLAAYSLAYANSSYPAPPISYPRGLGTMAGGDILRVCKTTAGLATETNGTCPNLAGSQNIEAGIREFYQDAYTEWADATGPAHSETFNGATASMPGYPGVWGIVYDVTGLGRQGVMSWGSCAAAAGGCRGPTTGFGSQTGGYDFGNLNGFNKGNALNDLEILCDQAPVQIGNRLWVDTDGDGIQDPGETPIVGATVRLYDSTGNLVSTAKTGPNGEYMFSSSITEAANGGATPDPWGGNVKTGETYTIRLDNATDYATGGVLAGYALTTPNSTTASVTDNDVGIDSNASLESGFPRISVPALNPGDVNLNYDAGFIPLVAISDYTWIDADSDGVQDVGESPLPGVKVQLFDADGNPARDADGNLVGEQTTDANGKYFFDNLLPGNYRVKFIPPDGYGFTTQSASAATAATNSDADRTTGLTPVFSVAAAVTGNTVADTNSATAARFVNPTIDAGFVPKVSVGDLVWYDSDRDGVQDAGEPGIAGVTLTITKADGSPVTDVFGNSVTTTTTDANGNYVFDNLPAGQYKVTVTPPTGYEPTATGAGTGATDSSTGSATSVLLGSGTSSDLSLDFGFYVPSVSVGNLVWFDTNKNGIQDDGEPPLSGVKLAITKADGSPVTDVFGNPVTSTYTDANGNYLFGDLPLGQYKVTVTTPSGMEPTVAGAGSDPAVDSSSGNATSANLTVDGASDLTLDFGFWTPPASVGSRVWVDLDMDGIQDQGEPGLAGVTLTLTKADGSPVTDVDGNPVGSVVTDADGNYLFSNLPFGSAYKVTIAYPTNYVATTANQGSDTTVDSSTTSATTGTMSLSNINDFSLDFGVVPLVSVGDYVWADTDRDGVQDLSESGIEGVTLSITKADGTAVTDVYGNAVTTTVTDSTGHYSFDNLPPGQYRVSVTSPSGLVATVSGVGSAAADSSTGSAVSTTLTTGGQRDATLDFGFYAPSVSVGDLVWRDADGDGVQDAGEPGIAGVTLTITKADGTAVTDVYGNAVTTTVTDSNGNYSFDDLPPGQYRVTVTPPGGMVATISGAGTSATDSLTGSAISSNLTTDGQRDTTLDFGFVPAKVSVGDYVWFDQNNDGVQDSTDVPLVGVVLSILNADGTAVTDVDGNPVTTTTTDADGHYLFENLPPGRYTVMVTPPSGYVSAKSGSGTSATDSSTGFATSENLTTDGSSDLTLDFGFVPVSVSVGDFVWRDIDRDGVQDAGEPGIAGVTLVITKADGSPVTDVFGNPVTTTTTDANGKYSFDNLPPGRYTVTVTPPTGMIATKAAVGGSATDSSTGSATSVDLVTNVQRDETLDFGFVVPSVSVGDYVWWDTNKDGLQDSTDKPIAGATLSITTVDGSPVTDVFGTPVTTTVTDSNGRYSFDNLPLGRYVVICSPPRNMVATIAGVGTSATDSSTTSATSVVLMVDGQRDPTLDFGFVTISVPTVSLGDKVWRDVNGDGLQGPIDRGVPGATLRVFDAMGKPARDVNGKLVKPQTTGRDGKYLFTNLPLGSYTVRITYPKGMRPTIANQPNRKRNSSTGSVRSLNLNRNGAIDRSLDFGVVAVDAGAPGKGMPITR